MNIENVNARMEEILRKQEKINADIEELNRHVEELKREELEQEKAPLGWIPEEGESYFYVETGGEICKDWNSDFEFELDMFKHTRVFKTKEGAEFEAERMKVLRELEKFACEFVYDFESHGGGYFICYDYDLNKLLAIKTTSKRHELYFESEKRAKEAIKSVGEDRVKKYYLEVKDN